ncbi:MAG: ApaG domain [Lactobacillus sp.]|jgi:ApaG protein|nr:ApaG domain [Lactobacillus sp.]
MIEEADFLTTESDDIIISARQTLVSEDSSSNLWGYYFCIENQSDEKIQLVGKDWNITDDRGNHYQDSSAGFNGELPDLAPGEYFEFTSMAPLASENAVFYGSCKIAENNTVKEFKIPTLSFAKKQLKNPVIN